MANWKKHPKKEGEEALQRIAAMGWCVENPPTYYTVKCPCGLHQRQIHLTPSNPHYFRQAVSWCKRICSPAGPEEKEEP
ncbi:hypothetical protein GCM10009546_01310 [Actinomadura livida]|uniref:Uncharacterized protein n=1 Tax=Actinomadura livida TaxID=79909 RepID=A0A7W7I793_9ACTN|nr:hypothetical protein [Actinomadura catellatispora]GGU02180.1 hypothetical protein GCM10010208_27550 [Actinomadura livida]